MTSTPTTAANIDSLDGLRGFACLLVVFSHAGNIGLFFEIPGTGQLGVMLFFALSGFLMEYLYGRSAFGLRALVRFSIRRFMRVYPVFALVVLGALLMTQFRLSYFAYVMPWDEMVKHLTLRGQVSVLWTVAVELKFYGLFSLAALAVSGVRRMPVRAVLWVFLAAAAIYADYGRGLISVWRYLEFFLLGMAAGSLFLWKRPATTLTRNLVNLGVVVCTVLTILSIPRFYEALTGTGHRFWGDSQVFAPLMALFVLTCAYSTGWIRHAFANPAARAIGRVSFSLYLIHLPCLALTVYVLKAQPPWLQMVVALSLALAASTVSYRLVEAPSRRAGGWLVARARMGSMPASKGPALSVD